MSKTFWHGREPWGLRPGIRWTAEAEANQTGLPLADVLAERARVVAVKRKGGAE